MTKDIVLLKHQERMEALEIRKVKELAGIESKKFEDMINAIGTNTISFSFKKKNQKYLKIIKK